jgi:hypothetical protein
MTGNLFKGCCVPPNKLKLISQAVEEEVIFIEVGKSEPLIVVFKSSNSFFIEVASLTIVVN